MSNDFLTVADTENVLMSIMHFAHMHIYAYNSMQLGPKITDSVTHSLRNYKLISHNPQQQECRVMKTYFILNKYMYFFKELQFEHSDRQTDCKPHINVVWIEFVNKWFFCSD